MVTQKAKVKADLKKNRLYITFSSTTSKMDLKKIYTDVRFCVADLKPNFDVVTDLSQCTLLHLDGISTLRKIMEFLVINKVGRVIRIAGDTNLAIKQLLAIAAKFHSYKPIYVTTPEEAEEELSCSIKPDGIRFQINQRQVSYSTKKEHGMGYIVDISTSGCAVQGSTLVPPTDTEISITIPLYQEQDNLSSFTIIAKVVWVRGNRFAVQFIDLDDDRKTQIYQCLANELKS